MFNDLFKKKKLTRNEAIIFNKEGNNSLKEAYIRLKDNILYFGCDGDKKVIQIESSVVSEGKTTTISNLGVSLGLSGKKVIIIDLDFHKPRLHRLFSIENKLGLCDFIIDKISKEQLVKKTSYENVSIINCGSHVDNTSIILTSEKLLNLIEELKKEYDFVLLDCPPILVISDYIHISRLSDGVLFIVAFGQTKKRQVSDAIRQMKNNGVNIFGACYTFYDYKKSNDHNEYNYGYYNYYAYNEEKK